MREVGEQIEITPGVCGGKPRIAGHRFRVMDIAVAHEQEGMSPEEILTTYPSLTKAGIRAALAYFLDHRAEIERDIAEERRYVEEVRRSNPSHLARAMGFVSD